MFGRLLGCYTVYTFLGILPPNGILLSAKFTLRPSLAFSYTGSVSARNSNSGHQPNFAVLSRGRHLYSAGRPSHWALAHVLVFWWGHGMLLSQVRRLLVVMQNRDAQYKHAVRKKESELARLKERLHTLLIDSKTETKLGGMCLWHFYGRPV